MGNFALVSCPGDLNEYIKARPFLKFLPYKWRDFFIKDISSKEFIPGFLPQASKAWMLKLPFIKEDMGYLNERRIFKACEQIVNFCTGNDVAMVSLEKGLHNHVIIKEYLQQKGLEVFENNRQIYGLLALEIIKHILKCRHIDFEEADIALIAGKQDKQLLGILKFLAPRVKYLTVACSGECTIRKELEELFEDTGLLVFVTNDLKTGIKEKDLVICFDSLVDFNARNVFKGNMVLLNLSDRWIKDNRLIECPVINDMEPSVPGKLMEHLKSLPGDSFDKNEFAMLVLLCAYGNKRLKDIPDPGYEEMSVFSSIFGSEGFKIKNLVGRNGIVQIT